MTPGQDFIEPDTVLKCGALQIKLPAFRRTSKVIFRPPLHEPGLTINPGWLASPGQPVYE